MNVKKFPLLFLIVLIVGQSICLPVSANTTPAIGEWLDENLADYSALYKELHATPELSFEEEKTAAKMAATVRGFGFEVTEHIGGHGVVAVLKNGNGPTLLLRADMDALPVAEETGLPYASQVRTTDQRGVTVGVMHACGHDMHLTVLLATLDYLATHRDLWQGTLVAIFQPAEERGAGAKAMIADGLLTKFPRPEFALALHVAAERPAGKLGIGSGYTQANVDSVDITIRGRGGHGAWPHQTIDPVVIAAKLVLDLQTIVSREIKPTEPVVITVGSIHGGTKHNIIPDECKLQLTVRTYSDETRAQVADSIRRKALAAAESAGAPEPIVEQSEGTPALFNDPDLTARLRPVLHDSLGEDNVEVMEPTMGGEDFGRYGRAGVPIQMMSLGTVDQERLDEYKANGSVPSLHSAKYYPTINPSLRTGVTTLTSAVEDLLPPRN
ncbi:amidohydrolase [Bythopirellula polymerisocia]|nr:amidohydrolase [Bythopirellula polymerisocia]